jgi:hypothetical protein
MYSIICIQILNKFKGNKDSAMLPSKVMSSPDKKGSATNKGPLTLKTTKQFQKQYTEFALLSWF